MKDLLTKLQLFIYTMPVQLVFADDACDGEHYGGISYGPGGFTIKKPCNPKNIDTFETTVEKGNDIIFKFIEAMLGMSLIIAVISIVISALELATSAGNPRKKEHAWHRMKYSLIGAAGLGGVNLIVRLAFGLLRS